MNTLLTLLKKDLGFYTFSLKNFSLSKKTLKYALGIVILLVYWYLFVPTFLFNQYQLFAQVNNEKAFAMLGFYYLILLSAFFNFSYVFSKLYFSKDTSLLFPLPISPKTILLEKILFLGTSNAEVSLFLTLPLLIKYAITTQQSPLFYVVALVNIITVSLLVSVIMCVIIVLLMSKLAKYPIVNKLVQTLSFIILMVFIYQVNFSIQGQQQNLTAGFAEKSMAMLSAIYTYFPFLKIIDHIQFLPNPWLSLGFAILALILIGIISWLSSALLGNTLQSSILSVSLGATKKIKAKSKQQSLFALLYKKEIKEILTTPIYLFNTLGGGIIFFVACCIPLVSIFKEHDIASSIAQAQGFLFAHFSTMELYSSATTLGVLLGLLISGLSSTTPSALSREGTKISLLQSLPIAMPCFIRAKIFANLLMLLPLNIIFITVFAFVIRHLALTLVFALSLFLTNLFLVNVGMFLDVLSPKLKWNNPQEVVKQNFNVFIFMMSTFGAVALVSYGFFKIALENEVQWYGFAVIALVANLSVLFYILACKTITKKLTQYTV